MLTFASDAVLCTKICHQVCIRLTGFYRSYPRLAGHTSRWGGGGVLCTADLSPAGHGLQCEAIVWKHLSYSSTVHCRKSS